MSQAVECQKPLTIRYSRPVLLDEFDEYAFSAYIHTVIGWIFTAREYLLRKKYI